MGAIVTDRFCDLIVRLKGRQEHQCLDGMNDKVTQHRMKRLAEG
jgi:hypothetical protein